jgi:hypothetical protein
MTTTDGLILLIVFLKGGGRIESRTTVQKAGELFKIFDEAKKGRIEATGTMGQSFNDEPSWTADIRQIEALAISR